MSDLKAFLGTTSAKIAVALALVLATTLAVQAADYVASDQPEASASPSAVAAEATPEPTPPASPSPDASSAADPSAAFNTNGGGAKNIVLAFNEVDERFLVRGRVAMNQVGGPSVAPVNLAFAKASCTDCTTLAIAGQVMIYKRGASKIIPQNAAVAVNGGCLRCITGAWAVQYVIPVDDMTDVPRDVDALVRALDAEMRAVETAVARKQMGLSEAVGRLDAVLSQFRELGQYLFRQSRIETASDSPSPHPTVPLEESPSPDSSPEPTSETPEATETTQPTDTTSPTP